MDNKYGKHTDPKYLCRIIKTHKHGKHYQGIFIHIKFTKCHQFKWKFFKAVLYDCKIKAFQTEGFGRYFEL